MSNRQPWECPKCHAILAPEIAQHRCQPAPVVIPPGARAIPAVQVNGQAYRIDWDSVNDGDDLLALFKALDGVLEWRFTPSGPDVLQKHQAASYFLVPVE